MEFTIEKGKLYMLQTRNGKRTAAAALKIACDMVDEGMVTKEEALMMVEPKQLDALLHPQFDAEAIKRCKTNRKCITGISWCSLWTDCIYCRTGNCGSSLRT